MKRLDFLWMMILMLGMSVPSMGAMSINKVRQNARFLTDRMAYELQLTPMQYDDVYEVNYDFINSVRYIMDDVVRGNDYAEDRYYDCLNFRNEDLRWILSSMQYRRFMGVEYFYRPIYTTHNSWLFRIYKVYHDVKHFYFDKPHHYKSYNGGHSRHHYQAGYYRCNHKGRYRHDSYKGDVKIHHRTPDFHEQGKHHAVGREVRKQNDNRRSSVNVDIRGKSGQVLDRKNKNNTRSGQLTGKGSKEVKSGAKGDGIDKTQKQSDKRRRNDGRRDEGRKASRN